VTVNALKNGATWRTAADHPEEVAEAERRIESSITVPRSHRQESAEAEHRNAMRDRPAQVFIAPTPPLPPKIRITDKLRSALRATLPSGLNDSGDQKTFYHGRPRRYEQRRKPFLMRERRTKRTDKYAPATSAA